jgi:hypothetical protein
VQCLCSIGSHGSFAAKRCRGSAILLWAARAVQDAEAAVEDGGGHAWRVTVGILWCDACGAFGEERARGLARPCRLHPAEATAARRRDRLRAGRHHVSGVALGGTTSSEPRSFLDALPAPLPLPVLSSVPTASAPSERMAALLARVRARAAAAAGGLG